MSVFVVSMRGFLAVRWSSSSEFSAESIDSTEEGSVASRGPPVLALSSLAKALAVWDTAVFRLSVKIIRSIDFQGMGVHFIPDLEALDVSGL